MPALFTRTRRSDGSSIDLGSSTSRRCTVIEPDAVPTSSTRSSPAFGSRIVATTSKPARARSTAMPRPMPRLAPVTTATPEDSIAGAWKVLRRSASCSGSGGAGCRRFRWRVRVGPFAAAELVARSDVLLLDHVRLAVFVFELGARVQARLRVVFDRRHVTRSALVGTHAPGVPPDAADQTSCPFGCRSVQTGLVEDAADDDVADHAVGLEGVDVGVTQTENAREHVAVVLAEER